MSALSPEQAAPLWRDNGCQGVVAPDNSSSSIGIMANVNPEGVIKGSNYDDNTLTKQFSVKGVFCP